MKSHSYLLITALVMATAGCVSRVTVKKVEPGTNPRGMRYYLPQPVVVGRPQPDGGIVYTIEYIPNLEREYAIDAWSFAGTHTAKLSRSPEMMLTKAELIQNTTEVSKQLLESAGNAGAELATQIGTQKTAERTEAKAAETARAAAQRTAASDLQEKLNALTLAQDDVDRAQARFNEEKTSGDAAKLAAAQITLDTSIVAKDKARRAVEFARFELDKFDDPTSHTGDTVPPKRGRAAGPVVYRIVEDAQTGAVQLVPLKFKFGNPRAGRGGVQRDFDTVVPTPPPAPKEVKPAAAQEAQPKYSLAEATSQVTISVKSGKKLNLPGCKIYKLPEQTNVTAAFKLKASADGKSLVVARTGATQSGEYRVELSIKSPNGAVSVDSEKLTVK